STTVVYYLALDDRLWIWTLARGRRTFAETPVRRSEVIHLLRQYRSEMDAGTLAGRDMPSLAALYDALMRPVAETLRQHSNLVIVPDGPLHAVPFAALVSREDRSYVIEHHAVQIAPSLTVFLAATARATTRNSFRRAGADALVFGNPRSAGE